VAAEPVYKDIVTKAKAKKLVELRYQMLPYNYTIAFENNQKGTPLMRPLFFEEPNNNLLLGSSESYLWGNELLVHPITKPGVKSASMYFPKNSSWFDFFNDKKYEGGTTQPVPVSEDHIPVFARGGAFVPMIQTIQNTSKYSLSSFDLHFYFDEKTSKSSGQLYNDDGQTPNAFEKGTYELLQFNSSVAPRELTLVLQTKTGKSFVSGDKNVSLQVHNLDSKKIQISVNGKNTTFKQNGTTIEIPVLLQKNASIKIQY